MKVNTKMILNIQFCWIILWHLVNLVHVIRIRNQQVDPVILTFGNMLSQLLNLIKLFCQRIQIMTLHNDDRQQRQNPHKALHLLQGYMYRLLVTGAVHSMSQFTIYICQYLCLDNWWEGGVTHPTEGEGNIPKGGYSIKNQTLHGVQLPAPPS